jgi:hypothetical protein
MTPEDIFYVYRSVPHAKGHIENVMLGKFAISDSGEFTLLEDHGFPENLAAKSPAEASRILHRYTNSMYYQVVNLHDLMQGLHPELLKDVDSKQEIDEDAKRSLGMNSGSAETPPAEFEFDRIGGEGPRRLSVREGQVFMDNHLLTQDEIDLVQNHVKSGKAFLRRKVKKAESIFVDPMARHLEEDSQIPGVGNLNAYNKFLASGTPGIHMHINMHGTGHINRNHGFDFGSRAIGAVGHTIKNTARELIGRDARVFRLGGDRFAVHVPSTEGAALLSRGIRQGLEGIPPVNGVHRLAVSIGVGPSKEHAEWAMHDAHGERNRRGYPPGQTKTHVGVRIPDGLSGPLPG